MGIKRVPLGRAGRDYVTGRLEGGLSLSALVAELVELEAGETFTWASEETAGVLADFDRGDVLGGDDARSPILPLVRQFFAAEPWGSLWAEDPLARRSDPFWTNPSIPRNLTSGWFLGEEVYVVAFSESDDHGIISALHSGSEWPGWGGASFLSVSAKADAYRTNHEVDRSDLAEVAGAVRFIICGAYDGTGWIVWERM